MRRQFPIAIFVAAAALLGGGQALAPAPALATVDNGLRLCTAPGMSWLDQMVCLGLRENDGGGDAEICGPGDETCRGHELIEVHPPRCADPEVICVPVGGSGSPAPPRDPDSRLVDNRVRPGGGKRRLKEEPFDDPQTVRERDERACLLYSRNLKTLNEAVARLENERKWGKSEQVLSKEKVDYILDLAMEERDIQRKKWIERRCRRFWT